MAEDCVGGFNGFRTELPDDISLESFILQLESFYTLPKGSWILIGNRCLAVFSTQFSAPKLTANGETKLSELLNDSDKDSLDGCLYFKRMGRIDPEKVFEEIMRTGEVPKTLHINPPEPPRTQPRQVVKPAVFPTSKVI